MEDLTNLQKRLDELAKEKRRLNGEASEVYDELFGENGLYSYVNSLPDRLPGKTEYLKRIIDLGERIPSPLLSDRSVNPNREASRKPSSPER